MKKNENFEINFLIIHKCLWIQKMFAYTINIQNSENKRLGN